MMTRSRSGAVAFVLAVVFLIGSVPCSADSEGQDLDSQNSYMDKIQVHGFGSLGFFYSWGTGGISNPFFSSESLDEKYYLMGTYRINDLFEVGSYYSANFENGNDKAGVDFDPFHSAFQKDWALTLRVDPVRYLIFKLEYHNVDGTGQLTQTLNPAGAEKNWNYFASKITFAF